MMDHDDHDGHDDFERTFHCSSTVGGTPDTEIPFSQVNDGTEDCGDGSDEPQDFDGDGIVDNWFDCMDGSNVSMEFVNDGYDDCPDGDDESHDDDHSDNEGAPTPQEFINMTDTDGNGTMSFDEFIAFMNSPDPDGEHEDDDESLPQSMVDELRVIFDNNDADQSGELDLDELDQFIIDTDEYFMSMDGGDGEPTQEELQFLFNASDADGDQLLNVTELGAFMEMLEDLMEDDHHDDHDDR